MISKSQFQADLEWAVSSPAFLKSGENFPVPEISGDVSVSPKTHRVGHYFESLIHFWLREIRGAEMIAHNHQVQEGTRTLGEVDFVFREETGEIVHWETAVKFYLAYRGESEIGSHFIGPNAGDTLEKKVRRIFDHQLPMGKRVFPGIDRSEAYVKGMIFYHPNEREDPPVSDLLALNHLRGVWIRESELEFLENFGGGAGFQVMEKPYWLAGPAGGNANPVTVENLKEQLAVHFDKSRHPNLVSVLDAGGDEVERIFVVNDEWPNSKRV